MSQNEQDLARHLRTAATAHFGQELRIDGLTRITAGASREVWAFDTVDDVGRRRALVLKRDPPADSRDAGDDISHALDRATEGQLMRHARDGGVPEPEVVFFPGDYEAYSDWRKADRERRGIGPDSRASRHRKLMRQS